MEPRPASKDAVDALPGLPDHEVLQELGRGGMGVVYLATNKVMGRNEVLKVVNPQMLTEPGAMDRFLQEIRSAAQLSHPNIVTAHAVLRSGESLVLAMEHIVGENLYKVVGERGPLPVANACYYVHQVAMGLQHACDKGMVHRDIKPDNLMLAREGKKHLVKILDFGLAKATREKDQKQHNLTGDGKMMGTPDYIAPEQILDAAKADIRADIYSLGCTLYFLLTGAPPFSGGSLYEKLQAHMSKTPTSIHELRNEVPVELAKIVDKMMAKEVKDRYQKPLEVAQALMPFVKGVTQLAAPGGQADPKGRTTTVTGAGGKSKGDGNTVSPTKTPKTKTAPAPKKTMIESDAPDLAKLKPTESKPAGKGKIILLIGGGLGIAGVFVSLLCLVGLWAGGVFRLKTPEGILVVQVDQPNADIFVDGERMTVTWDKDGKQAEIRVKPGTKRVQVKKDGLTFEGKDIEVRDGDRKIFTATLTPAAPLAGNGGKNPPPAKNQDEEPFPFGGDGFVALFNGKGLAAWSPHPYWRDENGVITATIGNPSPLSTAYGAYKDFHLRLEARVQGKGEVGFRVPARVGAAEGYWVLVGSPPGKARLYRQVREKQGVATGVMGPDAALPGGEWVRLEIIAQANRLKILLNGQICWDVLDEKNASATGSIMLAGGKDSCQFRRIEIKELPPAPVQPPTPIQPPIVAAPKDGLFVPLFNGENLTGWATHPRQPGNWRVVNGILVGSGPAPVSHLYTARADYKDFHLRVEARSGGFTGVYFRNSFGPADPVKNPGYPFGYNAKIDKSRLGGLIIQDGMSKGFIRNQVPFVPAGQWLTMEVIAEGNRIILKVNGMVTADYTDGLRRFAKGHITLQQHSAQTIAEFRRIEIKELSPAPPPPPMPVQPPTTVQPPVEAKPKEDAFLPLFNGKDTAGWKLPPGQTENWRVENGILMGPGKKASYLYSERANFKNFHLRAEARVTDGSEGGIYFHAAEIAEKRPKGYKVLLNINELDLNKAGSLFNGFRTDLKPVRESLVRPGEWFTVEVSALNNQTVVKIDGKQVVDFTDEKLNFRAGHIVLEQADAQSALDFRKIEIRELGPDAK